MSSGEVVRASSSSAARLGRSRPGTLRQARTLRSTLLADQADDPLKMMGEDAHLPVLQRTANRIDEQRLTEALLHMVVNEHVDYGGQRQLRKALPADTRCLPLRAAVHCTTIARIGGRRLVDDQITVRLPASLGRTLRRTSRRLGRRPSDIVRMALDAFLQDAPSVDSKRTARVEDLIGSLSSGIPDLAERHREYILASLKHGR